MWRARRWGTVALAGLIAAGVSVGGTIPARAAQPAQPAAPGPEVLDWRVNGAVELGGMWSTGERSSSKFEEYRDMSNGFLGEVELSGEKKDSPYYFDIRVKNPARDDQQYEGGFGRYGTFEINLDWSRTPHVLSNTAQTIYQNNSEHFTLPSTLRPNIATTFTTAPTSAAGRANIEATINGLLRPVDLRFNTDVARAGFKYTPTEALRLDVEYANIRREGRRPIGVNMAGSTSGPVQELAIPIENYTHEVKAGIEFARPNYGVQFNYTASIFYNEFTAYTWDRPDVATPTAAANATELVSAAPNNQAHTFNLTGTAALPLRSRVNGTFAYTMLRQDQDFEPSTLNPNLARTDRDDAGNKSTDAEVNLVLGNLVLTSRPVNNVTTTARFRYFEYQNDNAFHVFTNDIYTGGGTAVDTRQTKNERYTRMNAGGDIGWRPVRMLSLKAGYEFEHWSRSDFGELADTGATRPNFSTHEHIGKLAVDVTPVDWFLGRLTYTYGDRTLKDKNDNPPNDLSHAVKYPYADRKRNRIDALFQFTPWETLSPSVSAGYTLDDYQDNNFGLTTNDYWYAGLNLEWTPVPWITVSTDYTYEISHWDMGSRYLVGGIFPGTPANDWRSKTTDQYHNLGLNTTLEVIPKKFSISAGYFLTFGLSSFLNTNPNQTAATAFPQATAFEWDKIWNWTQTARVVGNYRLTPKLSLRGGFAYERFTERNWQTDPMQPFMGNVDSDRPGGAPVTQGVQSVWLGAKQPNYEAYTLAGFVRYAF